MPRPIKLRKVCSLPDNCHFGPLDKKCLEGTVTMTVDEYETIRLIDLEGCTQEECSKQMSVARTTVQSIYTEARHKLAEVLVNGKRLVIEGGEYVLCNGPRQNCHKGCHKGECMVHLNNKEKDTMIIAIPVDENKVTSSICPSFGRCPYFAFYNVDTKAYEFIENAAANSQGGAGIQASQIVIDHNATVLIAPRLGQNAADVLNAGKVVLLQSINDKTLEENIKAFNDGKLGELTHIHPGFHGQGEH